LHHLACGILHHLAANDEIGVAQANLAPGGKAIEPLRRVLQKVVALNKKLMPERDAPRTGRGVLRVVYRDEFLATVSRIGVDADLEGAQYAHPPRRVFVQQPADRMLKHRNIDDAIRRCDPASTKKVADRRRGDAAAA